MHLQNSESFKNEFLKLDVNLIYHASLLAIEKNRILRKYNITWQQFNILSILRLYHPKSLNLMEITSRMIDPASNTSRLVEKLRQKGLAKRLENDKDRRRVDITITRAGLQVCRKANIDIESNTLQILSHLSETEARKINDLLDRIDQARAMESRDKA